MFSIVSVMIPGFIPPSYLKGIARLADMWGSLDHFEVSSPRNDSEALKSDWEMVGKDMWKAIEIYEKEHSGQQSKTSNPNHQNHD